MSAPCEVLICMGSGGVGKTTLSAAIAVQQAKLGKRVLVLTIDPAKRLSQTLGISEDSMGDVKVPEQSFSGVIYAGMIHSNRIFEDFIREASDDEEKTKSLLSNTLYKQLSTTLSGSQEFTSLDRLYRAVYSGNYDLVILDTPPAQHALDFLNAPVKIKTLFQKSITKWFADSQEKQGLMVKIVSRGTMTVLSALEKVTGSAFIRELSNFFTSIQGIQDKIVDRVENVDELLKSEKTKFCLVTSFNEAKLKEAQAIFNDLKNNNYSLDKMYINRSYPKWFEDQIDWKSSSRPEAQQMSLIHTRQRDYYQARRDHFKGLADSLDASIKVIQVPEMQSDVCGLSDLSLVAEEINQ